MSHRTTGKAVAFTHYADTPLSANGQIMLVRLAAIAGYPVLVAVGFAILGVKALLGH
jgi:hypothetical protein